MTGKRMGDDVTAPWRRVDRIFSEALELDSGERKSFLDRIRRESPDLIARVEHLLSTSEAADSFLEAPVEEVYEVPWDAMPGRLRDDNRNSDRSGAHLGPWRLIRQVGRGGMASVYLAERADGEWRQQVAVKLLHRGLDTAHVLRRFRTERQILSSLHHPGIARFLGGGTSEDGLPFLVMEYVDGTPILEHCDRERLPVEDRIRLFCQVGRALHAAHRQLVVHRDVKPSNVLIDADGVVRLLDFGVAKLLAPDGDLATRVEHQAWTPAYASPEQVGEGPITTASDVYQMGLLLCELLVGDRPYAVRSATPAGAVRAVLEAVPKLPSTLVTTEAALARRGTETQLTRKLTGDLDSIVFQALEKDPGSRYGSALAMVEDLERYLRREPVLARAGSVEYRFRKFVKRHRLGVGLAGVALLALMGAAGLFAVQAERAARERDRALAEQVRAERVTTFMSELFSVLDPAAGGERDPTSVTVLQEGVRRARISLAEQPLVLADILGQVGEIYSSMSMHREAVPLLEEALALRAGKDGPPSDYVGDLIRLGYAHQFVGGDRQAATLLQEAVAVAEDRLGPEHPRLAEALTQLADVRWETPDEQRTQVARAVAILRQHSVEEVGELLAEALYMQAFVAADRENSLTVLREALEIRRELYGGDHPGTAVVLNSMGLFMDGVDPVAADTLLQEAAAMHERLYGSRHRTTLTLLNNHAGVLRDQGRYSEAEPIYRRVLEIRSQVFPGDRVARAYILHGFGWVLTEQGRAAEAEPLLREMLDILEEEGDHSETWRYQVGRNTLGRALAVQGRHAEAEPLLRESYAWIRDQDPSGDHGLFRDRLADLYRSWGRPVELAALDTVGADPDMDP